MRKIFVTGLLAASFFVAGCNEVVVQPKPPVVKVQQVKPVNAADEEIFAGVVRGRYESNLSFQVGAHCRLKFRGGEFT